MFLVYKQKLPNNLQNLYMRNITDYSLRNPFYFKKTKVKSSLKKMCMSIYGVELLQQILPLVQNCDKLYIFKRRYKEKLLLHYD